MDTSEQWWGYNKEHGWVVLDREIPCNRPGARGELMFFRCRDEEIYFLRWEHWKLPAYRFALKYLKDLTGEAADEARAELDALLERLPEFKLELRRQYQAILDKKEALRLEEVRLQKVADAAQKKTKRAATAASAAAAAATAEEAAATAEEAAATAQDAADDE